MNLRVKILLIYCVSFMVILLALFYMQFQALQLQKAETAKTIRNNNEIILQESILDYQKTLGKKLDLFLITEDVYDFFETRDQQIASRIEGIFLGLDVNNIIRLNIYDKEHKIILTDNSDHFPKSPDSLPEELKDLYTQAAEDLESKYYFRNYKDSNGKVEIEYSGMVAVTDDDDNILGYIELSINPMFILKEITSLTKGFAAFMHTEHRQFGYSTDPEQFKKIENQLNGIQKDRLEITALKDGIIYRSDCIPIRGANNKLIKWLWITEDYSSQAQTQKKNLIAGLIILFILIIGGITGTIILINKSVINPINFLVEVLNDISKGNLKIDLKVKSNDEIGKMLMAAGHMVQNMANLIGTIKSTSTEVAHYSEELSVNTTHSTEIVSQVSTAISNVARGTGEQSNSINNIMDAINNMLLVINAVEEEAGNQVNHIQSSAQLINKNDIAVKKVLQAANDEINAIQNTREIISQMLSAIEQVTTDAANISSISLETEKIAKSGEEIVSNTVNGMEKISNTVLDASEKIDTLGKRSLQIGEITDVIDDIAEQTNLLALNAAIEAARAGEHGRGFAVVADEVRKLAERSSTATKEIAGLIKLIQSDTDNAVKSIEIGTEEVKSGTTLAKQTQEALANIVEAIQNTVNQIQNISASAEEMSASSQSVVSTVDEIDKIVKNNTTSIDELVANSSDIVTSADNIKKIADKTLQSTQEMKTQYHDIDKNLSSISAISQDTSSLAEEVTASTEQVGSSVEEIAGKTKQLVKMSEELNNATKGFKV